MPAKPRSDVFDPSTQGDYLCGNETVRGRHLMGEDLVGDKDVSYRKKWIYDQLRRLASAMAIQVLDFAILGNLFFVILRNRPDLVADLSDEEVARRWWRVCPKKKDANGEPIKPTLADLADILEDIDEYRRRLSDISWLMRLAQQRVARRANTEDGASGRFFAHRFTCEALSCEAELLRSSLSVSLEGLRSGQATSVEDSKFTAAFERVASRVNAKDQRSAHRLSDTSQWVAPIGIGIFQEGIEAKQQSVERIANMSDDVSHIRSMDDTVDLRARHLSDDVFSDDTNDIATDGFLPMTLDEYLTVLKTVARCIVHERQLKNVPRLARKALRRLGLSPLEWLNRLLDWFRNEPARSAAAPV